MPNALYSLCSGEQLSEMVINEGPERAFTFLYGSFNRYMDLKIRGFLGHFNCFDPQSHGQDIGQIMWESVIVHLRKFKDGKIDREYKHPHNFLFTIGRCLCFRHLHAERPGFITSLDEDRLSAVFENAVVDCPILLNHSSDLQQEIEMQETIGFVKRVFTELSEDEKEIIDLVLFNEIAHMEVGKRIGITAVAARKRYSRALRVWRRKCLELGGL